MNFNRVILAGRLTREPELRAVGSTNKTELSLAINEKSKDRNGNEREDATFCDVVVWGKQAETCSRYLAKGSSVFIEGRLRTESWEDRQTGKKRSRLIITAERVQFLDRQTGNSAPPSHAKPLYQSEGHKYPPSDFSTISDDAEGNSADLPF